MTSHIITLDGHLFKIGLTSTLPAYFQLLLYDLICVTPCVTEGLIKLIKMQLNPNARLNQDIKVWNQIQRQRFKISSSV
jgi:hypothetical protein